MEDGKPGQGFHPCPTPSKKLAVTLAKVAVHLQELHVAFAIDALDFLTAVYHFNQEDLMGPEKQSLLLDLDTKEFNNWNLALGGNDDSFPPGPRRAQKSGGKHWSVRRNRRRQVSKPEDFQTPL